MSDDDELRRERDEARKEVARLRALAGERCADCDSVWIVIGRTGEYSDRTEWCVRAFSSEQEATDFRSLLLDTYRRLNRSGERLYELDMACADAIVAGIRSLDPEPGYAEYFAGVYYSIKQVPFGPMRWSAERSTL